MCQLFLVLFILLNNKVLHNIFLGELEMDRIFLNENNENNREEKKFSQKKSFDFNLYKNNTINSINDVEHFLNNFHHYSKYFKLFKILKK